MSYRGSASAGAPAGPTSNGTDAVLHFVAQENYPANSRDRYPVRLKDPTAILTDFPGGAVRPWRGGLGIVREYYILAEEAMLAVRPSGQL